MTQKSIIPSCKTNLPSLLQSTFPIWIYLPYWYLTSLLASNHHTNLFTSILYHYSYISQQSSKPSCIFNLTSLPITPIYYPYLITNLLPLPVSNTPTCITTQHTHTHMYTSWSWQILLILIDPDVPVWHFSIYWDLSSQPWRMQKIKIMPLCPPNLRELSTPYWDIYFCS